MPVLHLTEQGLTAAITKTTDDPLYQACRYGSSNHAIFSPTSGSYTVMLKFSEPTKTVARQRKFNASLERTAVLEDFDIYAGAGAET